MFYALNATVTLKFDLKIYKNHLLTMSNLPTKKHDFHSLTFQDIEQTRFLY